MTSPPRRARFQIHLSTAIVLMFVAGGLIWANVSLWHEDFVLGFAIDANSTRPCSFKDFLNSNCEKWHGSRIRRYGWPWALTSVSGAVFVGRDGKVSDTSENVVEFVGNQSIEYTRGKTRYWDGFGAFDDLLVAFAILFTAWFLCERLVRRRAARKGA